MIHIKSYSRYRAIHSLTLSIRPFYCHIIRGHTVHDIRIDRHFFGLHFPWRIYFVFKKWSSSGLFYGRICWGYLLNPLNLELEFWYFVKSTSLVTDCWCPLSESIQTSSGKATTKLFCLGRIKDHNVEEPIYYPSEKIFSVQNDFEIKIREKIGSKEFTTVELLVRFHLDEHLCIYWSGQKSVKTSRSKLYQNFENVLHLKRISWRLASKAMLESQEMRRCITRPFLVNPH